MEEKVAEYNTLQDAIEKYKKTHISLLMDDEEKEILQRLKDRATHLYLEILYSNPAGFNITARMTTNYRCLKNIYIQRKNHRLPEWREFCKWIETLPYFEELINTNTYEND